jgi:hypothetical protein
MNGSWAKQVETFQKALASLEQEFVERIRTLLVKLADLLGAPIVPVKAKPGRKRKVAAAAPAARPAARGRRGRKANGGQTLPELIVKVLKGSKRPLRTKEIMVALQKVGWQTSSADPQKIVYKTLYRIEKSGVVIKAEPGKFTAPK